MRSSRICDRRGRPAVPQYVDASFKAVCACEWPGAPLREACVTKAENDEEEGSAPVKPRAKAAGSPIDEYVAQALPATRPLLQKIRAIVHQEARGAVGYCCSLVSLVVLARSSSYDATG